MLIRGKSGILTVSIKGFNSFVKKKKENVFSVFHQVLFFLYYIFANKVYFAVVLKSEKLEKQHSTNSVKDHKA